MSKFESKFNIFIIDLRVILWIIVATFTTYSNERGGVKDFLNNVKKNCTFLVRRLPLEQFSLFHFFVGVYLRIFLVFFFGVPNVHCVGKVSLADMDNIFWQCDSS